MDATAPAELLPARMINELVYCPRLFWLEYVEREFAASFDTVDGERIHRRVDQPRGELPDDIVDLKTDVTSVELASQRLGVVAKVDLIRAAGIAEKWPNGSRPDRLQTRPANPTVHRRQRFQRWEHRGSIEPTKWTSYHMRHHKLFMTFSSACSGSIWRRRLLEAFRGSACVCRGRIAAVSGAQCPPACYRRLASFER